MLMEIEQLSQKLANFHGFKLTSVRIRPTEAIDDGVRWRCQRAGDRVVGGEGRRPSDGRCGWPAGVGGAQEMEGVAV
jgi:hypothetical protein